jgi:hypothetical protein
MVGPFLPESNNVHIPLLPSPTMVHCLVGGLLLQLENNASNHLPGPQRGLLDFYNDQVP